MQFDSMKRREFLMLVGGALGGRRVIRKETYLDRRPRGWP
jgi:hypothetical protein